MSQLRIFISYSSVDQRTIEEIVKHLRRAYDHVWFDANLHGGQKCCDEILRNIADFDIFLYLLSRASIESPYCQQEFSYAQQLGKHILPVLVRARTQIPPELSQLQYVDLSAGLTLLT